MSRFFARITFCFLCPPVFLQTKTVDVDKDNADVGNAYFTVAGEPFVRTKIVRLTEESPYFKDEGVRVYCFRRRINHTKDC